MKKSEILKSIKIALLSFVLLIGVGTVFADEWTAPPCGAPDCNTATPINIGNATQTKEGDLDFNNWLYVDRLHSLGSATFFDEVRIGSAGEAGDPSLSVLGDVTLYNLSSNNTDNEGTTYPNPVCVKTDGTLSLCDSVEVVVPEVPTLSGEFRVKRVTGSGSGTVATCFEELPYIVGGGGYCINAAGIIDPTVRKSEPVKSGEVFYNAWRVECAQGGADVSAVAFAHCSD
jgi:hypothetical protein